MVQPLARPMDSCEIVLVDTDCACRRQCSKARWKNINVQAFTSRVGVLDSCFQVFSRNSQRQVGFSRIRDYQGALSQVQIQLNTRYAPSSDRSGTILVLNHYPPGTLSYFAVSSFFFSRYTSPVKLISYSSSFPLPCFSFSLTSSMTFPNFSISSS